jgi:hypothetical protein
MKTLLSSTALMLLSCTATGQSLCQNEVNSSPANLRYHGEDTYMTYWHGIPESPRQGLRTQIRYGNGTAMVRGDIDRQPAQGGMDGYESKVATGLTVEVTRGDLSNFTEPCGVTLEVDQDVSVTAQTFGPAAAFVVVNDTEVYEIEHAFPMLTRVTQTWTPTTVTEVVIPGSEVSYQVVALEAVTQTYMCHHDGSFSGWEEPYVGVANWDVLETRVVASDCLATVETLTEPVPVADSMDIGDISFIPVGC